MIQRVEAGRDLTSASLAELGRALPDLVERGVTVVRLEVSRVVEFDSAALEGLLEFDALARSRSLAVELLSPGETLATALEITGLAARLTLRAEEPVEMAASGEVEDDE